MDFWLLFVKLKVCKMKDKKILCVFLAKLRTGMKTVNTHLNYSFYLAKNMMDLNPSVSNIQSP